MHIKRELISNLFTSLRKAKDESCKIIHLCRVIYHLYIWFWLKALFSTENSDPLRSSSWIYESCHVCLKRSRKLFRFKHLDLVL